MFYLHNRVLRQVLNEVLRLSVLAPYAARYSDDDIVAGGYLIPAGTPIVIALGVSLKNDTIWNDTEKYVENLTYSTNMGKHACTHVLYNWL